jgi:hypothetical protein
MRVTRGLVLVSLALSAAAAVAQGCAGKSSGPPPAVDAGPKDSSLADTAPADSGPAVDSGRDSGAADTAPPEDTTPPCPVEASLTDLPLPPDASLPHDASVAGCLSCATGACGAQVMACDDDCKCKEALVSVFECATTSDAGFRSCVGLALAETNAFELGTCLFGSCTTACGIEGFSIFPDSGGDAIAEAAADGAQDAPAESSANDAPADNDAPPEAAEQ